MTPSRRRALFRRCSSLLLVLAPALAVTTAGCAHQLVFAVLDPGGFDAGATPPAPDYAEDGAWAALPARADDADVALPELPATDQTRAPVDVFFVHTTTWLGRQWNAAFDDEEAAEGTAYGSLLIQASAFNACGSVYAPRYRQVNGQAFTEPSPDGARALEVAYADVLAAFERFLSVYNRERPFVLAAHSQGTALAARLLRERIADSSAQERLVAAYLVGGPLGEKDLAGKFPLCAAPDEVGCVVAFNARGPDFEPNSIEFVGPQGPGLDPMAGRLCVNPLSWHANGELAPPDLHRGALFFDTEKPRVLPHFSDARCQGGTLVVNLQGELPERRVIDDVLLWMMGEGNYHPIEYQLFYVNLRENAVERVRSFVARGAAGAPVSAPLSRPP